MKNEIAGTSAHWQLGPLLGYLFFVAFATALFAGGKGYPVQGIVTALGTAQDTTGGGGETPVLTHLHRSYTVKTDTRVFVLECPYDMNAVLARTECGGKKKKITIGETIHFRLEKNSAFLLNAEGKEEKLRVLSESMSADGNAAPAAAQPH
ncbi:MAG TPA: hypothetical protein VMG31_07830 [Verrucomicrobiae bacterium]|nr:hypothetical protein [Verrucomicrobiae bacterium]